MQDKKLEYQRCFDCHGREVTVSKQIVATTNDSPFKDVDFITISKDDARNIAKFIQHYLDENNINTPELPFDSGISFERLCDRLTPLKYF